LKLLYSIMILNTISLPCMAGPIKGPLPYDVFGEWGMCLSSVICLHKGEDISHFKEGFLLFIQFALINRLVHKLIHAEVAYCFL